MQETLIGRLSRHVHADYVEVEGAPHGLLRTHADEANTATRLPGEVTVHDLPFP